MTVDYLRDEKGRFIKGTPQPYGFGKGKQKIPWNYNGSSIDNDTGYRIIYVKKRKEYEHRLVWEFHHGEIPEGYVVHHIDNDKLNNDITNLECMSRGEHNKLHGLGVKLCR